MPAKSEKQRRFMAAVANNPEFAKKAGVPQSVGEEFMMKKYREGGPTTSTRPRMRPEDLMDSENTTAPRRSPRPRRRPKEIEDMMSPDTAVGRGNRASMREAEDMRTLGSGMKMGGKVKMKQGGKVRGYGKARGAKPCKMM